MSGTTVSVDEAALVAAMPSNVSLSADQKVAIMTFAQRFHETRGQKMVDNSALPCGAPMTYYCRGCDVKTATLPESHTERVPALCDACAYLNTLGLLQPLRTYCEEHMSA